jgi:hypothetical protein
VEKKTGMKSTYKHIGGIHEDMAEDIGLIHRLMGRKGLESIPDIGQAMERWSKIF